MAYANLLGERDEAFQVIEALCFREAERVQALARLGRQRRPREQRIDPQDDGHVCGAERPNTLKPLGNGRSAGVPEGPGVVPPEGQRHFDLDGGVVH